MCNNCISLLQLHTCWISEAVHSGKDRLLGIVVSEELTAALFSVIVCGKAVHLFPLAGYRVFFYLTICRLSLPPLVGSGVFQLR